MLNSLGFGKSTTPFLRKLILFMSVASLTTMVGQAQAQTIPDIDLGQAPRPTPNLPIVGTGGEYATSVKIDVPAFHDLPVQVSLNYNSANTSRSGVDNVVAFGWSLNAYSVIERKSLGGGAPTFDDGQDIYVIDGSELMACGDTYATNKWTRTYPLRYVTNKQSGSCTAGGNFVTRVDDNKRVLFDQAMNKFVVTHPNGLRYTYAPISWLQGGTPPYGGQVTEYFYNGRWLLTEISDQQTQANKVTYTYEFGHGTDAPTPDETRTECDGGLAYTLAKISYGGYQIEFNYSSYSAASMPRFATGSAMSGIQTKQLHSIIVKNGASVVRGYQLGLGLTSLTNTALLNSVKQYGSDLEMAGSDISAASPTALPAETFSYSPDTVSYAANTGYVGKEFHESLTVLDWDRDGSDELYFSPAQRLNRIWVGSHDNGALTDVPETPPYAPGLYKVASDKSLSTMGITPSVNCKSLIISDQYSTDFGPGGPALMAGDGDGRGSHGCLRSTTSQSNGVSLTKVDRVDLATGAVKGSVVGKQGALPKIGNFDLDFDTEIVTDSAFYSSDEEIYDIAATSIPAPQDVSNDLYGPLQDGVDFTGDGVDDYLYQGQLRRLVAERGYLNGGMVGRVAYQAYSLESSTNPSRIFLYRPAADLIGYGDIDGNGLNDVIYHQWNGGEPDSIVIAPSTGAGFASPRTFPLLDAGRYPMNVLSLSRSYRGFLSTQLRMVNQRSFVRDINNDGRLDLIIHDGFTPSTAQQSIPGGVGRYASGNFWIFLNDGSSFVNVPMEFPGSGSLSGATGLVGVGDFDGDGLVDIVREGANGQIVFGTGGIPSRMVSRTTGTGSVINVAYKTSVGAPFNRSPRVLQVVDSITTVACPQSTRAGCSAAPSTVSFSYAGASYDYFNRMPLGFRTVVTRYPAVSGESKEVTVKRTYLNTNIVNRGLVESEVMLYGNSTYSRNYFTWDVVSQGNGPFSAEKSSVRTAQRFGTELIETRQDFTYNLYGQLTGITDFGLSDASLLATDQPRAAGDLVGSDTTFTQIAFEPALTPYIVDRPRCKVRVKGKAWSTDRNDWLEAESYSYDGNASASPPTIGNITNRQRWLGNYDSDPTDAVSCVLTRTVWSATAYDDWGNLLGERDAKSNLTTYTYDAARHLFRLTVTNALSQVTEATNWDETCQAPQFTDDVNGQRTSFTYDKLCREVGRDLPGDQYSTTDYVGFGHPDTQYIETRQPSAAKDPTTGAVIEATSRRYFDGLGRTYQTRQLTAFATVDPSWIAIVTEYDLRGQVAAQSNPLTFSELNTADSAGLTDVTSFAYDPVGRLVQTTYPDNSTSKTTYSNTALSTTAGSPLYPLVVTQNPDCFDTASSATTCLKTAAVFDAWGRKIRDISYSSTADVLSQPTTKYIFNLRGLLEKIIDPEGQIWLYGYDALGNRTSASDPGLGQSNLNVVPDGTTSIDNPDVGPWTMEYDANNNLTRQVDAKGQAIEYTYDALNRVTTKDVITPTGTTRTAFTYDCAGGVNFQDCAAATYYGYGKLIRQMTSWPSTTGSYNYPYQTYLDYTATGQVAAQRNSVNTIWYNINYTYGADGKSVTGIKVPTVPGVQPATSSDIAKLTYDVAGHLRTFSSADGTKSYITNSEFDRWGNQIYTLFGNGARDYAILDDGSAPNNLKRGWVQTRKTTERGGTLLQSTTYDRGASGRIVDVTLEADYGLTTGPNPGSFKYAYDYAGRLTSALSQTANASLNQTFAYDDAGRMLSNSTVGAYSYDNIRKARHAPSSVTLVNNGGTATLTYDANGNMTKGLDGKIMEYDGENRPLSVTLNGKKTCYVYGPDGARWKKVEGLPVTTACADAANYGIGVTLYLGPIEVRNWRAASAEAIYAYPVPNIRLVYDGTSTYATALHRDGLGTVRAVTQFSTLASKHGKKAERSVFRPYGQAISIDFDLTAANESKGYIGERYDGDAGLQYLNARYYDPKLGMFIQPDWWEVTKPGVGTNRYAYAGDDPVNGSDPGGNDWWSDVVQHDEDSWQHDREEANSGPSDDLDSWQRSLDYQQAVLDEQKAEMDAQGGLFGPEYLYLAMAVEIAANQMANSGPTGMLPDGMPHVMYGSGRKASTVQQNRAAHQAAVEAKVGQYKDQGLLVTREVTFKGPDGRRARCDIVCSDPITRRPIFAEEVKTGNGQLERNQSYVYQSLRDGTAIPVGRNAASAGFEIGVPVGKIEYRGPIPK